MTRPFEFNQKTLPIVLGITGASGAVYAVRTLQWLIDEGVKLHVVVSPDGLSVIRQELGFAGPVDQGRLLELFASAERLIGVESSVEDIDRRRQAISEGQVRMSRHDDYFSPIASGSYRTAGMVICPCSGTSMAAIAHSSGRNLIHRAAEVHLKERRKLILVPRETPLSLPQIENMLKATQAGAVVLPAAPGWYHGISGLKDIVDFIAARILDQLGIDHSRTRRWQDD